MKDEEMAEEKLSEEEYKLSEEVIKPIYYNAIKNDYSFAKYGVECFLAGLKAGRPQWHTPDARLPEEEGDYLFCLRDGEETMYDIVGVSIDGNGYVFLDSHIWSITDVIAWKEIVPPKESE